MWALAILANHRLLLTVAVVLSTGELMSLLRVGRRHRKTSLLIATGLFGTLLFTEAAFQVGLRVWQSLGGKFSTLTYLNQLQYFLFEKYDVSRRFDIDLGQNIYNFAHYLNRAETWPLILLGVAGIAASLARPARMARPDCVYAIAVTVTALLWMLQHFNVPRVVAVVCLFLPLFAGSITWDIAKRLRLLRSPLAPVLLLVGYACLLAGMTYRIGFDWFSQPSAYRELAGAVAQAGDAPLYAYWRQQPCTSLYVVDRPINQIEDESKQDQDALPAEGLLVAESDYVEQRYPDAEVLGRWNSRRNGNELALAEDLWSWDESAKRKEAKIDLLLVRLNGPARRVDAKADVPIEQPPGGP